MRHVERSAYLWTGKAVQSIHYRHIHDSQLKDFLASFFLMVYFFKKKLFCLCEITNFGIDSSRAACIVGQLCAPPHRYCIYFSDVDVEKEIRSIRGTIGDDIYSLYWND